MEMKEIRDKAREAMKGYCRVCPVCDGRACVGEVPGMGGVGTASSFADNLRALADLRLNMRVIHRVDEPDTSLRLLGRDLSLPILAAPIGGVDFNMGGAISEREYVDAVLGGCAQAGIMGCTGDGAPAHVIDAAMEGVAAVGGLAIPFIKPWECEELDAKIKRAEQAGAKAVGMDLDAAGLITLKLMGRPVRPKGKHRLSKINRSTNLRLVLKGIMTVDDAKAAVQAGAAGIVVSNHGGRVLDHTPGAAEVLGPIAEAVKGELAILVDGGVRSGGDVLKLLALGADAVMIGRPFSVAAIGGGRAGVVKYIETLRAELITAMILTGCADLGDVGLQVLFDNHEGAWK